MSSTIPSSAEYDRALKQTGEIFHRARVTAIYCVHGTFAGNDALGIVTELERVAPAAGILLAQFGKGIINLIAGEAGNYTQRYRREFEEGLAAGAQQPMPVRFFNWSSQNNHIGRADGAVRLLVELARHAEQVAASEFSSSNPPRVLLWGHSHGGNVFSLLTNLIGADEESRDAFFTAAHTFYTTWFGGKNDVQAWEDAQRLLAETDHPIHQLKLDLVTFGTPIRYAWDTNGYDMLLHFVNHRVPPQGIEYQTPVPMRILPLLVAKYGDYVQQIGVKGTNFIPVPLFVRTLMADWRLNKLLQSDVVGENLLRRLRHGTRVPDEGTTLLVDYREQGLKLRIFGHAVYTRREWLPFHCLEVADRFYGAYQ